MRIGLDIDGTVVEYIKYIDEKGKEYFGMEPINKEGYGIKERYNVSTEIEDKFWDKYNVDYYKNVEAKEGFKELIEYIEENNHELVFITSRHECKLDTVKELTEEYLDKEVGKQLRSLGDRYLGVIYTELKADVCMEQKVDVLVDDYDFNIEAVSKVIPVIRMCEGHNYKCNGENIEVARELKDIPKILEKLQK